MLASEIVVPKQANLSVVADKCLKLRRAYISARQSLELIEIELNRSKIVMIDEHGRVMRVSLTPEH